MENTSAVREQHNPPLQFSIKTLLLIMGFCCLLLVPYQWFGIPYLISAFISSLMVFGCLWFYGKNEPGSTIGIAALSAFLGAVCGIGSITFLMHGACNFLAVLIGSAAKIPWRGMAVLLTVVALGIYGFAFKQGYEEYLRLEEMRVDYPIVSLEERLMFEREASSIGQDSKENRISVTAVMDQRLSNREQLASQRYADRSYMLERLHRDASMQFASAAGFGFIRMAYVTPGRIEFDSNYSESLPVDFVTLGTIGDPNSVASPLHEAVIGDFLNPEAIGFVALRKTAAGFEPHSIRTLELTEDEAKGWRQWQLVRLELVSLLRHDPPQVYIADSLPAMDELQDYPHRELDNFEQSALPKLVSQQDIVTLAEGDRLLMLGSLRASNDCLQCHEGQRGKLLGAFSYELARLGTSTHGN